MSFGWKPYVSVAKRRTKAAAKVKQLRKKGKIIEPIEIEGRKIAHTFWGKSWCDHMEKMGDYANRLPRGRTYVRNGSVCHLGIHEGQIEALVSGSSLYNITISIKPLATSKWQKLREKCTGQIGSLLELLQGRFSDNVMKIVTHQEHGLFPNSNEIEMKCSCPDWADLCKHLAAVLYGVGARLDDQPELLFKLRGVDHQELIDQHMDMEVMAQPDGSHRKLENNDLADLFGVELDNEIPAPVRKPSKKKTLSKKVTTKKKSLKRFTATGKSIAGLRNRLALNKSQFARLIGVTPPTIGNWENASGKLNLQQKHLDKLQRINSE